MPTGFFKVQLFTLFFVEALTIIVTEIGGHDSAVQDSLASYFSPGFLSWIIDSAITHKLHRNRLEFRNPIMHGEKTRVTLSEFEPMLAELIPSDDSSV